MFSVAAIVACLLAGCGTQRDPRANDPRPALMILVSASISDRQIKVSPDGIGAGSVQMILANRSQRKHTVTLTRGSGNQTEVIARTRPIEPGQTTRISAKLQSGDHLLTTEGRLASARLSVGPDRQSASDELLTP